MFSSVIPSTRCESASELLSLALKGGIEINPGPLPRWKLPPHNQYISEVCNMLHCSACGVSFVPESVWSHLKSKLHHANTLQTQPPALQTGATSAVLPAQATARIPPSVGTSAVLPAQATARIPPSVGTSAVLPAQATAVLNSGDVNPTIQERGSNFEIDPVDSCVQLYTPTGCIETLPGTSVASVRRHLEAQRLTESDKADMTQKTSECLQKNLTACASCGRTTIKELRQQSLRNELLKDPNMLEALRYEVGEKWPTELLEDCGLVLVEEQDGSRRPVALYKEVVGNEDGVPLCNDCCKDIQNGLHPQFGPRAINLHQPSIFADASVLEIITIAPVIMYNTILACNLLTDKFSGHLLATRKQSLQIESLPRVSFDGHVSIVLSGAPWPLERIRQRFGKFIIVRAAKVIQMLKFLTLSRPDIFGSLTVTVEHDVAALQQLYEKAVERIFELAQPVSNTDREVFDAAVTLSEDAMMGNSEMDFKQADELGEALYVDARSEMNTSEILLRLTGASAVFPLPTDLVQINNPSREGNSTADLMQQLATIAENHRDGRSRHGTSDIKALKFDDDALVEWYHNDLIFTGGMWHLFAFPCPGFPKSGLSPEMRSFFARAYNQVHANDRSFINLVTNQYFRHSVVSTVKATFKQKSAVSADFQQLLDTLDRKKLLEAARFPKRAESKKLNSELSRYLCVMQRIEWSDKCRKSVIPIGRSLQVMGGPASCWNTVSPAAHNFATCLSWSQPVTRNGQLTIEDAYRRMAPGGDLHDVGKRFAMLTSMGHTRSYFHLHASLMEHMYRLPLNNRFRAAVEFPLVNKIDCKRRPGAHGKAWAASAVSEVQHGLMAFLHMHMLIWSQLSPLLAMRCAQLGLHTEYGKVIGEHYTTEVTAKVPKRWQDPEKFQKAYDVLLKPPLPYEQLKQERTQVGILASSGSAQTMRNLLQYHDHEATCVGRDFLIKNLYTANVLAKCRLAYRRQEFPSLEMLLSEEIFKQDHPRANLEVRRQPHLVELILKERNSAAASARVADRYELSVKVPKQFTFDSKRDLLQIVSADDPCLVLAMPRSGLHEIYGVTSGEIPQNCIRGNMNSEPLGSVSEGATKTGYMSAYSGKGCLGLVKGAPFSFLTALKRSGSYNVSHVTTSAASSALSIFCNQMLGKAEFPKHFCSAIAANYPSEICTMDTVSFPALALVSKAKQEWNEHISREMSASQQLEDDQFFDSEELIRDVFSDSDDDTVLHSSLSDEHDAESVDSDSNEHAAFRLVQKAPHGIEQQPLPQQVHVAEERAEHPTVTFNDTSNQFGLRKVEPLSRYFTPWRTMDVTGRELMDGEVSSSSECDEDNEADEDGDSVVFLATELSAWEAFSRTDETTSGLTEGRIEHGRPASMRWVFIPKRKWIRLISTNSKLPIFNCCIPVHPGNRPDSPVELEQWYSRADEWAIFVIACFLPWRRNATTRRFLPGVDLDKPYDNLLAYFEHAFNTVQTTEAYQDDDKTGWDPAKLSARDYVQMGRWAVVRNCTVVNQTPKAHKVCIDEFHHRAADPLDKKVIAKAIGKHVAEQDDVTSRNTDDSSIGAALSNFHRIEEYMTKMTKVQQECRETVERISHLLSSLPALPPQQRTSMPVYKPDDAKDQYATLRGYRPWRTPAVFLPESSTRPRGIKVSRKRREDEHGPNCWLLDSSVSKAQFFEAGWEKLTHEERESLSKDQRDLLKHMSDCIFDNAQPMPKPHVNKQMHIIQGLAGAGKTHTLRCAQVFAELVGGEIGYSAYTGVAGILLGFGKGTIFRLVGVDRNVKSQMDPAELENCKMFFRRFVLVVCDEWSMMTHLQLGKFYRRIQELCGVSSTVSNWGIPFFLCGDCHQCGPAVRGSQLLLEQPRTTLSVSGTASEKDQLANLGYELFRDGIVHSLPVVVGVGRFTEAYQKQVATLIQHPEYLRSFVSEIPLLSADDLQLELWRHSTILTSTHYTRCALNNTRCAANAQQIALPYFEFVNSSNKFGIAEAVGLSGSVAERFPEMIVRFCIGDRVMILDGVCPERGVGNGTKGKLVGFSWKDEKETKYWVDAYNSAAAGQCVRAPLPTYAWVQVQVSSTEGTIIVPVGRVNDERDHRDDKQKDNDTDSGRGSFLGTINTIGVTPLWALTIGKSQGTEEQALIIEPNVSSYVKFAHWFVTITRVRDGSRLRRLAPVRPNFNWNRFTMNGEVKFWKDRNEVRDFPPELSNLPKPGELFALDGPTRKPRRRFQKAGKICTDK